VFGAVSRNSLFERKNAGRSGKASSPLVEDDSFSASLAILGTPTHQKAGRKFFRPADL
jgi:hypothetical protein